MSHHEMYVRAVMADRMREARAARRAISETRAPRRGHRLAYVFAGLITRTVLR